MKVLIVSPANAAVLGAGDFQQALQTVEALRRKGVDVAHRLIGENDNRQIFSKLDVLTSTEMAQAHVIHVIPAPPGMDLSWLQAAPKNVIRACSTVYWDSLKHRVVCELGLVKEASACSRYVMKRLGAALGLKRSAYAGIDLLLPNSRAEARVLSRFYQLSSETQVRPIHNGLPDSILGCVSDLVGLKNGQRDVVLYPGLFSPRKNQLRFIRAMRDSPYEIVFMGGPLDNERSVRYFAQCKSEAPDNWVFTGRVDHLGQEFTSWMLRARVACLTSSCETPGLALLEAGAFGARPVITQEGGTVEYYDSIAEYVDSHSLTSIRRGVEMAWQRGELSSVEKSHFDQFTWSRIADELMEAYDGCLTSRPKGQLEKYVGRSE